mgnify:CR=1 FL=1
MTYKTHEELLDEIFGPKGTPERDEMEAQAAAEVQAYNLGLLIKEEREAQHLTQEQLGAMIGVKKSQVSRMERSGNMTFTTLSRVFNALKVPVTLTVGNSRKVALW